MSMKIKGGAVDGLVSSYNTGTVNEDNDGGTRLVKVSIGCTPAQLEKMFGEEMRAAVFGLFVERPIAGDEEYTEEVWLQKEVKPWKKTVVFENHKITLGGGKLTTTTQPVLLKCVAVDEKTDKVNALVAFKVGRAETKVRHYLDDHHGRTIKIKFEVSQTDIDDAKRMAAKNAQLSIIKDGVEAAEEAESEA